MNKNLHFASFILLFFILESNLTSQTIANKLSEDAIIFGQDFYTFFTAPIRFDGTDWLYTAGLTASTFLMFQADDYINRKTAIKGQNTLNGDFWDHPTRYGIVQYGNIAALGGYGISIIIGNDEMRRVTRMLFQSLSYSGITVMGARILAGRYRPYLYEGPYKFIGPTLDDDLQSFPSGHTTVAFAISTVLAEYYDNNWVRIPLYGIATLTAYARMRNNMHWFSDVVVGALIGFAGGYHTVIQERKRMYGETEKSKFSFVPTFNGLNIIYRLD